MEKLTLNKGYLLILIVGVFSIINVYTCFYTVNYLSLINSIVGIVGVILFLTKKPFYKTFIWLWVCAQIIVIDHTLIDPISNYEIKKPVFDCTEVYSMQFGFYVKGDKSSYGINYNALTIVYFILFRYLMSKPLQSIPEEVENRLDNTP